MFSSSQSHNSCLKASSCGDKLKSNSVLLNSFYVLKKEGSLFRFAIRPFRLIYINCTSLPVYGFLTSCYLDSGIDGLSGDSDIGSSLVAGMYFLLIVPALVLFLYSGSKRLFQQPDRLLFLITCISVPFAFFFFIFLRSFSSFFWFSA